MGPLKSIIILVLEHEHMWTLAQLKTTSAVGMLFLFWTSGACVYTSTNESAKNIIPGSKDVMTLRDMHVTPPDVHEYY